MIMQLMTFEDVLKKIGLQSNTIKAGEFKDTGSPFRKMTPAEKEYMDGIVRNIYEQFMKDIAVGRKMNIEVVRNSLKAGYTRGPWRKMWASWIAMGNFYDTVDALKEDLKIKGKPVLVYAEKPFSFSKWIFGSVARDFSKEMTSQLLSSPFKFIMNQ